MPLSAGTSRRYTVEEYFEIEQGSPEEKYEYREGVVVGMRELLAMSGGSVRHSLIAANTGAALGQRLRGGPCRVYSSDLRVAIPRKALFTYPDVTVVCGKADVEPHPAAGDTLTNPRLIVEVLSPSTETYVRGRKFDLYREIPSFAEYVLISQAEARVDTFFHRADGGWSFGPFAGLEAVAKLQSIEVDLPLADVYAGVEFPS